MGVDNTGGVDRACWVYGVGGKEDKIIVHLPTRIWLEVGGESHEEMERLIRQDGETNGQFIKRCLEAAGYTVKGDIYG